MKGLVIVTGGTKGIGKGILEKFAQENYPIVTCARSIDDLNKLKVLFAEKYSSKLFTFMADLSIKEETIAFANFIKSLNFPIKVLVNNAGTFIPGKVLEEPDGALETLINTNLYSAYYLTRSLMPIIETSGPAHIFNMCSIASLMAYPQSGSYTISKFAMLGFSKSLREDLKSSQIKVTTLLPGAIYTDSWAASGLPEDRFMQVSDIADLVWSAYNLSAQAVVEEIIIRPLQGDI